MSQSGSMMQQKGSVAVDTEPVAAQRALSLCSNDDVKPLPASRRTWTFRTYLSWWSVWLLGITNFQLGSSLVATGLSIWQTMTIIVIGRTLTAGVAVLLGHVGAKWHISYPVYSRAVWGVYGSLIPIGLRILVGLIGFAIQSWLGALNVVAVLNGIFPGFYQLRNTLPDSAHVTTKELIGWLIFNVSLAPALLLAPEHARRPMAISVIISFITLLTMTAWCAASAQSLGALWSAPSAISERSEVGWAMVSAITSVIGAVAPALVGQADFTRFSRTQIDQILGQSLSFIVVGCVTPLLGCIMSAATQTIYGQAVWNPTQVLDIWLTTSNYSSGARAAVVFAGLGLFGSQYSLSIVDSAYSVGIDMAGIFPRWFTIRRGSYFGLVISIAACPWELLTSGATFLAVISSLVVFFAGVMGIMVADYWVVRKTSLDLPALYQSQEGSLYYYTAGINMRSALAWICSLIPLLPGMVANINHNASCPIALLYIYKLTVFLGFLIAFGVYWLLAMLFPMQKAYATESHVHVARNADTSNSDETV